MLEVGIIQELPHGLHKELDMDQVHRLREVRDVSRNGRVVV